MMHPQSPRRLFLALLAAAGTTVRAAEAGDKTSTTATAAATPCVATSASGAFYDLRPDVALPVPSDGSKKLHKGIPTEDYVARGWDYGSNFTLNICNSVVKPVDDVVGIDRKLWANVSAYYDHKGKVYSLGQQSSTLVPRGRKLVLQYTNGSPCGSSSDRDNKDKSKRGSTVHDGAAYKYHDYDHDQDDDTTTTTTTTTVVVGNEKDDDDDKKDKDGGKRGGASRRKSATISFLCDREPMNSVASASFIGTDPDECAYFFEIRSQHACAGAEPHKPGSVGPGSVFAIILAIAVLVYFVGGVFYQRTVAHARGWRQLPNYSMWSGMWSFVKDIFIILTSSCARFLPSRRGYRTLSISPTGRNSSSRNTGNNRDDSENRLIDQLDEEWDD